MERDTALGEGDAEDRDKGPSLTWRLRSLRQQGMKLGWTQADMRTQGHRQKAALPGDHRGLLGTTTKPGSPGWSDGRGGVTGAAGEQGRS